ncbi:DUF4166 domain-containing protein [Caulobacter sp. 17J80-11]|uniref:DUF4166 domain-containing protein n=1 Tax=Caulobacter sp. 17J80-11 TaxID=2763502 RepID=UPI001653B8DC|nr:DUF4166 domain-containing protein [Caulobacter sp. 17J80-11]MBC6980473.1 DUF4166 domain-containing protein [Caulobacter sp. 17J80-11]
MKLLILGGYGMFGGRLARLLADEPRLTLVLAGRSRSKADAFAATLPSGGARIETAVFDRDGDVGAQLAALAPDMVVDASGPFQGYGEAPYRVVEAALAVGCDYLDLADGSDFVLGIGRFDEVAGARGRFVLSGVSSCPLLTATVVRSLAHDMARVDRVVAGIAPSPFAKVGLNVVRAVIGYAGKPVPLVRDGRPALGTGWAESRRFVIRPPGRVPLKNMRFSLVDVPDLRVMPELWPEVREVWMGAGTLPESLHRVLNALAGLVRSGLAPSLAPLAPLANRVMNALRWGEHRGGMFVEVAGAAADGRSITRSWHLTAEGDDGPHIPSMGVEAIVRRMLDGKTPAVGARPATHELDMADYERLFARRAIHTGVREPAPPDAPLYRRILGEAFERLPEPVRVLHDLGDGGETTFEGVADVERGRNPLATLVAAVIGFPRAGRDVPVTVRFRSTPAGEVWRRTFAGHSFFSVQSEGRRRAEGLVTERFGPMACDFALVLEGERLKLAVRGWRMFGVPMPAALAPGGEMYEAAEDGRFRFHVEIGLPLVGLVVRYRGTLARSGREPDAAPAQAA